MITYPAEFLHLSRVGQSKPVESTTLCLALAHNEANVIGEFLDHYRSLGPVSFAIVDDHSTDGTREILEAQPDVTIYQPKEGSTYARDKRAWRSEILDACADGKWCLAPDIDEHLVYKDMGNTPLPALIAQLEAEGAEALFCIMVDMYADKPLAEHEFVGGGLRKAFPLFDRLEGQNYRFLMAPRNFRKRYPTPLRYVSGGMYERLFRRNRIGPMQYFFLKRYADLSTPMNLSWQEHLMNAVGKRLLRDLRKGPSRSLDLSKLALIKWRAGMQFSGGTHAVSRKLRLSERRGALLHYKFTRGAAGIRYNTARGQHAGGGVYYKGFSRNSLLLKSPADPVTTTYNNETSLGALLR